MVGDLSPFAAPVRPFRLLVAGVGGAGCRALRTLDLPGVEAVAIHTDAQALAEAGAPRRLQIGASLVHGTGTGGDTSLGAQAAEADAEMLRALFQGYDLVFFITSLGGGTGSGAMPVLARLAHESSCLTLVLAGTPFAFEGDLRGKNADAALERIRRHADAVAEAPNERLVGLLPPGQLSLARAFELANESLGRIAPLLHHLISRDSLLRLDFADLRHFLRHASGAVHLATFALPLADLHTRIAEDVLISPLLDRGQALTRAQGLLVAVEGGAALPLHDLDKLSRELRSTCLSPPLHFTFAATASEAVGDEVRLLVFSCERWVTPAARAAEARLEIREEETAERPAAPSEPVAAPAAGGAPVQIEIPLPTTDLQGKFANTETTTVGGADLDIPTFLRRGLRIKPL